MHALDERGLATSLIFSGQHPGLDAADHDLDHFPAVWLACPGQQDAHAHAGEVSRAVLARLSAFPPELVVVQGDTSTALGAALAARLARVPVAHVEAGLRSHDSRRPWPEEEFRVAIDSQAQLLFAPTELSAANLRRERVPGTIHVTGNSGIDALLRRQEGLHVERKRSAGMPKVLVTCHRRENWSNGIDGVSEAVRRIVLQGLAAVDIILHPNPSLCSKLRDELGHVEGVRFVEPCTHAETLVRMLQSDVVLSDSGGIQEEAATLGVALLVLRDKTERPEAIASGNIELVGTSPDRIVSALRRRLKSPPPAAAMPFGDGSASKRIAAIVDEWLQCGSAL